MTIQEKNNLTQTIVDIVESLQSSSKDWIDFARCGLELQKVGIQYKQLGYKKLKDFLYEFSGTFEFKDEKIDNNPPVYYMRPQNADIDVPIEEFPIKKINKINKSVYGIVQTIRSIEPFGFEGYIMAEDGTNYKFNERNWINSDITINEIQNNREVEFELKRPNAKSNIFPKNIRFKGEAFNINHSHGKLQNFVYVNTRMLCLVISCMVKDFLGLDTNTLFRKVSNTYNNLNDSDFVLQTTDNSSVMLFPSGFFDQEGHVIYMYCTPNTESNKQEWECDRVICNNHVIGGSVFDILKADWYDILSDLKKYINSFEDTIKIVIETIERRCLVKESSLIWLKDGCSSIRENADHLYVPTGYKIESGEELYLHCLYYRGVKGHAWYYDCITYENAPLNVYNKKEWLGLWAEFNENDMYPSLAYQTLEEKWSFGNRNDYGILKNYISYTFSYQWEENNIGFSDDKRYASFNTGLPDKETYKYIYAFFEKTSTNADEVHPLHFGSKYRFKSFAIPGRGGDGKLLSQGIRSLPKPPKYFETRSDTVWELEFNDSNQPELPEYDDKHILIHRCDRIPLSFYQRGANYSTKFREIIEKPYKNEQERCKDIREYFYEADNDIEVTKVYTELHDKLKNIIERSIKRLSWNWRAVVPCYNPEEGKPCFLLPVSFDDNIGRPDRAMIVTSTKHGEKTKYHIHTVIKLDMAYLDARLVCRPETEWLSVDNE